jgi:hypothetical protein
LTASRDRVHALRMSDPEHIRVRVHVINDGPKREQVGEFDVWLPARPHAGDWLNVANEAIIWEGDAEDAPPRLLSEVVKPGAPAVLIREVVFDCDLANVTANIHVFATPGVDPLNSAP